MVLISGIVIGAIGAGFALWFGKQAITEINARWKLAVRCEAIRQANSKVCNKCSCYTHEAGDITHPPISRCIIHGVEIRHSNMQSCTRWRAKDDK